MPAAAETAATMPPTWRSKLSARPSAAARWAARALGGEPLLRGPGRPPLGDAVAEATAAAAIARTSRGPPDGIARSLVASSRPIAVSTRAIRASGRAIAVPSQAARPAESANRARPPAIQRVSIRSAWARTAPAAATRSAVSRSSTPFRASIRCVARRNQAGASRKARAVPGIVVLRGAAQARDLPGRLGRLRGVEQGGLPGLGPGPEQAGIGRLLGRERGEPARAGEVQAAGGEGGRGGGPLLAGGLLERQEGRVGVRPGGEAGLVDHPAHRPHDPEPLADQSGVEGGRLRRARAEGVDGPALGREPGQRPREPAPRGREEPDRSPWRPPWPRAGRPGPRRCARAGPPAPARTARPSRPGTGWRRRARAGPRARRR